MALEIPSQSHVLEWLAGPPNSRAISSDHSTTHGRLPGHRLVKALKQIMQLKIYLNLIRQQWQHADPQAQQNLTDRLLSFVFVLVQKKYLSSQSLVHNS